MTEIFNNPSESLNVFSEIENELNDMFNPEKDPWIEVIVGVKYAYDKFMLNNKNFYYNTSIFNDFCWLKKQKDTPNLNFQMIIEKFNSKINFLLLKLNQIKSSLEILNVEDFDNNKKKLFLNTIDNNIVLILLAKNWFIFELEKAGYISNLSEQEIVEKIKENERLETIAFGWKISENKKEAEMTYKYILSSIDNALLENKITRDEYEKIKLYLKKIWDKLLENGFSLDYKEEEKKCSSEIIESHTSDFLKKYWNIKISRGRYFKLFKYSLDMHGIEKDVISSNVASVTILNTAINFPEKKEFDNLEIHRILKLFSHEIWEHCVSWFNHNIRGNMWIRCSWYIEKWEWLARFMDTLVLWKKLDWNSVIIPNFAKILAGEILDKEEYLDFNNLFWKTSLDKNSNPYSIFLRQKRNYPLDYVWVQHKDVTYVRWLIKVLNFLEDWWDISTLFKWKFSIEDIKDWQADFIQDLLYPIFVSDMIIFYFTCSEKEDSKFNHEWFVKFLSEKYWKNLPNFNWNDINKLSFKQMKIFSKMILIIKEDINNQSNELVNKIV